MLVLSRRTGEEIVIDGNIRVTVVSVQGDRVRIGITAPRTVPVDRKEVRDRRGEFGEAIDQPTNNAPLLDTLPILREAGEAAVNAF